MPVQQADEARGHPGKEFSSEQLKSLFKFNQELETKDQADFVAIAKTSAQRHKCQFLFEFPALLIDEKASKAAAILCPANKGCELVFLVFNDTDRQIDVIDASKAPEQLVSFAWSFTEILTTIPTGASASLQ